MGPAGGVCIMQLFFFLKNKLKINYQAKHCLAVPPHPVWINTVRVQLLKFSGK